LNFLRRDLRIEVGSTLVDVAGIADLTHEAELLN
jgi:hypothetical protein